ncbi:hypothetical protein V1502_11875 [Bacillus sp. SCS-153A]|uniref:hypothetical protein n=1 Tax=Rossellomorea sedimentorum TaxID=3115294 RepID=UPI003905D306
MNRIVSSIYISVSLFLFFLWFLAKEVLPLFNSKLWLIPSITLVIGLCYFIADLDSIQKNQAKEKEKGHER